MAKSRRNVGSMIPASTIVGDIEARRETERSADPDDPKKSKEESENTEESSDESDMAQKAIDDALPETVLTCYGEVKYAAFKKMFSSIYDQVRDKDHLINGRIVYEDSLAGIDIRMHNLRAGERRSLLPMMANPQLEDLVQYNEDDLTYRLLVLVVALEAIEDLRFDRVPSIKGVSVDEWQKDPAVIQAIEALEDLDESLLTMLYQLFMDINNAKQYALVENLKNR
jgi:hypothetical protein